MKNVLLHPSLAALFLAIAPLTTACSSSERAQTSTDNFVEGTASTDAATVLLVSSSHSIRCTGTLIAKDVVLTAAQCLRDIESVYVGYSKPDGLDVPELPSTDDTWEKYEIAEQVKHPDWKNADDGTVVNHDIALLRLTAPVTNAEPAKFVYRLPAMGAQCTIVGYGQQGLDGMGAGERRQTRMKIVTVDSKSLTVEGTHGIDDGDVGGSWICNESLLAVSSTVVDKKVRGATLADSSTFIDDTLASWK
jgi:Trypsin